MILGQGWDERSWPDPRPPTRAELDEAGRGRAIYLARVDVHSAVVSSGLLGALPDVDGLVGYRPDGLLTPGRAPRLPRPARPPDHRRANDATPAASRCRRRAALGVGEVHELGGPHLGPLADLTRVVDAGRADRGARGHVLGRGRRATRPSRGWPRSAPAGSPATSASTARSARGRRRWSTTTPTAPAAARSTSTSTPSSSTSAPAPSAASAAGSTASATPGWPPRSRACAASRTSWATAAVRAARHRLEHVEMVAAADLPVLARLGRHGERAARVRRRLGRPGRALRQRVGRARDDDEPVRLDAPRRACRSRSAPTRPSRRWPAGRWCATPSSTAGRTSVLARGHAFACATVGGHRRGGPTTAGTLAPGSSASFAVWDVERGPARPGHRAAPAAAGRPAADVRRDGRRRPGRARARACSATSTERFCRSAPVPSRCAAAGRGRWLWGGARRRGRRAGVAAVRAVAAAARRRPGPDPAGPRAPAAPRLRPRLPVRPRHARRSPSPGCTSSAGGSPRC